MSDKTLKYTFWVTTILFSLMMAFSGFSYLTNEEMRQGFVHLGFPGYFRVELALAKFAGAAALLFPVPARLKEWAYAGFAITLTSAFIAHVSVGDAAQMWTAPLIAGAILAASYYAFRKLNAPFSSGATDAGASVVASPSAIR